MKVVVKIGSSPKFNIKLNLSTFLKHTVAQVSSSSRSAIFFVFSGEIKTKIIFILLFQVCFQLTSIPSISGQGNGDFVPSILFVH